MPYIRTFAWLLKRYKTSKSKTFAAIVPSKDAALPYPILSSTSPHTLSFTNHQPSPLSRPASSGGQAAGIPSFLSLRPNYRPLQPLTALRLPLILFWLARHAPSPNFLVCIILLWMNTIP